MKHLDDRVSDLVDDRLDHDERDRALAHLAGCEQCREAADMERFAKGALTSLPGIPVPSALTSKLLALAEPGGPLPAEVPAEAATVAAWGPSRPAASVGTAHASHAAAGHRPRAKFIDRHRKGVRFAASGMVSTGAVLVMLASLGAPSNSSREQTPVSIVPPMEEFTAEYARSTGGLPFAEPASILVPALSWDDGLSAGTGPSSAGTGLGIAGDGW
ncbi:hypothetical protein G1H11_22635 [Phytoactinopolyspora alkaliphila]|uniref:Putative zinc-finger domain-containing protein n=1 Tax=Phytoactinopolyspora alkaliphila TaxID=1783498 RepID=A0A6N9YT33_9ACTN|nr:zf-HC2 domain-containing protein [Phytoactinopolyspora alkaliphila]NED98100.1 hypothetical protein [Phytoactinopolyspora alkaliphila]